MSYTTADGRAQVLQDLGDAVEELALALACLGEAYEHLDDQGADRLEEQLFRPVQVAYGRAKRTYAEFAERMSLPSRTFAPRSPGTATNDPRVLIERGVDAGALSGQIIADLQDSMLPVEVGDAPLRAGLAEVRELVDGLRASAREFSRSVGR
jgi:hypothetical protein